MKAYKFNFDFSTSWPRIIHARFFYHSDGGKSGISNEEA